MSRCYCCVIEQSANLFSFIFLLGSLDPRHHTIRSFFSYFFFFLFLKILIPLCCILLYYYFRATFNQMVQYTFFVEFLVPFPQITITKWDDWDDGEYIYLVSNLHKVHCTLILCPSLSPSVLFTHSCNDCIYNFYFYIFFCILRHMKI